MITYYELPDGLGYQKKKRHETINTFPIKQSEGFYITGNDAFFEQDRITERVN